MSEKHTPGPWLIHDASTLHMQDVTIARLGEDGRARSCRVVSHAPDTIADAHADAHLIAAAPDLLALLEELNRADVEIEGLLEVGDDFMRKVRAAITKARGGA
jgi:aryl-alcohol dehydrogenase-like predicted oxidoreductase